MTVVSQPQARRAGGGLGVRLARDCRERRAPRGPGVQLSYAKVMSFPCWTPGRELEAGPCQDRLMATINRLRQCATTIRGARHSATRAQQSK